MFSSLQRTSIAYYSFISFITGKLYTPNGNWTHNLTQHLTLTREEVSFELLLIGRYQIPLHSMLLHFGSLKLFLCSIGDAVGVSWINHYISVLFLALWKHLALPRVLPLHVGSGEGLWGVPTYAFLLEGLPIVYIFVNWLCYFYFIYICIW